MTRDETAWCDPVSYPSLAAYLALLPAGLASYPECRARGTMISSAVHGHAPTSFPAGLPDPLRALIETPPLPGAWLPAVYSDAVFHAVVDRHYAEASAMLEWTRSRTIRTAQSKMYRALTRVVGPGMLLRMVGYAHSMFQRGTELGACATEGGMELVLSHPPFLHVGFNHLANVAMIEAVLQIAAAPDAVVTMTASGPTSAVYVAHWS